MCIRRRDREVRLPDKNRGSFEAQSDSRRSDWNESGSENGTLWPFRRVLGRQTAGNRALIHRLVESAKRGESPKRGRVAASQFARKLLPYALRTTPGELTALTGNAPYYARKPAKSRKIIGFRGTGWARSKARWSGEIWVLCFHSAIEKDFPLLGLARI